MKKELIEYIESFTPADIAAEFGKTYPNLFFADQADEISKEGAFKNGFEAALKLIKTKIK